MRRWVTLYVGPIGTRFPLLLRLGEDGIQWRPRPTLLLALTWLVPAEEFGAEHGRHAAHCLSPRSADPPTGSEGSRVQQIRRNVDQRQQTPLC